MLRSVLLSAQRQLLCWYFSENDFRDDGTEITGSFLFSPKLPWGDNYTLHENAEHILRSKYYFFPKEIAFDILFSKLNPALPVDGIADVWGTSITSSPLKRSVLDCASACQVGGYFSGMIWRDNAWYKCQCQVQDAGEGQCNAFKFNNNTGICDMAEVRWRKNLLLHTSLSESWSF